MIRVCPTRPYLFAAGVPVSAGQRLLAAEEMELLGAADEWSRLRTGMPPALVRRVPGSPPACVLCGKPPGGLPHLTASCPGTAGARADLREESSLVRSSLTGASNEGEWVALVFSAAVGLEDLKAAVRFAAGVVRRVQEAGGAEGGDELEDYQGDDQHSEESLEEEKE